MSGCRTSDVIWAKPRIQGLGQPTLTQPHSLKPWNSKPTASTPWRCALCNPPTTTACMQCWPDGSFFSRVKNDPYFSVYTMVQSVILNQLYLLSGCHICDVIWSRLYIQGLGQQSDPREWPKIIAANPGALWPMIIAPWLIPSIMAYFNLDEMQCRGFGSLGVTFDPNLKLRFIPFSYIFPPFRVAARSRF